VARISGLVGRVLASPPRSARHKLHQVRFGRLIGSLLHFVELSDDASDKLGGEWILDRSYVASFVGRTLDRAREIVFDSAVLTGDHSAELHARLDAVRADLGRLMSTWPPRGDKGSTAMPLESGGDGAKKEPSHVEEPEYRLLRAAIRRLALTPDTMPGSASSPTVPHLAEVVQEAHERALRSFEGLHFRSWGQRAGSTLVGSGFPAPVRVVDSGGGVAPAHRAWGSSVGWERVDSAPLRALLGPLVTSDRRRSSVSPEPGSFALAVLGAGRSTVALNWPTGALLVDARLEDHAAANFVYCALRSTPMGRGEGLERVLTQSGFRQLDLGVGTTGWMSGQTPDDTRDVLGRMGRSLEALLLDRPSASRVPRRPLSRTSSGVWRR
jgi:hypothetical protein